jgi:putative transposase
VVGYNPGWKQGVQLGRKTNQAFVGIPFEGLVKKLVYKAEDAGIRVIVVEESDTSARSFLDNDPSDKSGACSGRRVSRGLYRSREGVLVNADANGAGNIGRKAFPLRFRPGIVDAVSRPVRLHPWN